MSNYSKQAPYRIASTEIADLYWSNSIGWTDDPFEIDYFTSEEVKQFEYLPIDGKFVKVEANQS